MDVRSHHKKSEIHGLIMNVASARPSADILSN